MIGFAQKLFPNIPIYLHGHSMGGLTLCSMAILHDEYLEQTVKGLIIEAPWISECPQRKVGPCLTACVHCIEPIFPNLPVPAGVDFYTPDLDPAWVKLMKSSPLASSIVTPRLYNSVSSSMSFVRSHGFLFPRKLPILFLQGKRDDLVEPASSIDYINGLISDGRKNIKFCVYDEGPHVLLKTKLRPIIGKEILDFIHQNQ